MKLTAGERVAWDRFYAAAIIANALYDTKTPRDDDGELVTAYEMADRGIRARREREDCPSFEDARVALDRLRSIVGPMLHDIQGEKSRDASPAVYEHWKENARRAYEAIGEAMRAVDAYRAERERDDKDKPR